MRFTRTPDGSSNSNNTISYWLVWLQSISLLLFEAEVLPEAADGGLEPGAVFIVGGRRLLSRTHGLSPQSTGPGGAQRSHGRRLTPAAGLWLRQTWNLGREKHRVPGDEINTRHFNAVTKSRHYYQIIIILLFLPFIFPVKGFFLVYGSFSWSDVRSKVRDVVWVQIVKPSEANW